MSRFKMHTGKKQGEMYHTSKYLWKQTEKEVKCIQYKQSEAIRSRGQQSQTKQRQAKQSQARAKSQPKTSKCKPIQPKPSKVKQSNAPGQAKPIREAKPMNANPSQPEPRNAKQSQEKSKGSRLSSVVEPQMFVRSFDRRSRLRCGSANEAPVERAMARKR